MIQLTIHLGRNNYVVKVEGTAEGTNTTINAGNGNDVINVSGPPDEDGDPGPGGGNREREGSVDKVASILTVNGELGIDQLNLIDNLDPTGDTVTVTDMTIGMGPSDSFFGPNGGVIYTSIATLQLFLGLGGDHGFVESTHAETETFIFGGDGDEEILVRNGFGTASDIRNLLDVHGGKGQDQLVVDDAAESAATTVTITGQQVGAGVNDNLF